MEQINVPGQTPKKGMSKGCLVGLIVVGVLAIMIVVAGLICYMKKDELLRAGCNSMVSAVKTELMNNPVQGVDTVMANRVADAFLQKMSETELDLQEYGRFATEIQAIMEDNDVDSAEAERFVRAMVDYFPELEDLATPAETQDSIVTQDSVPGQW